MAATKSNRSRPLTPKTVAALAARDERYDVSDGSSGLVLRVHPSGVKSFRWPVRSLNRVIVIGPWADGIVPPPGYLSLRTARVWLGRLKEARAAGEAQLNDEVAKLQREVRPARQAEAGSEDRRLFKTVCEEFYRDDAEKNRKHPKDVRRILDTDLIPVLGARPLDAITTLECRDCVKRTVARGAPVYAGKVLATLKQIFNWAQANGFTERNPSAPLRARHIGVEVNISDRFLSAEEIPLFWKALDAATTADRPEHRRLRASTAAALKILLLTAVRSGELLRARWEHLDLKAGTWTIPVENQKLTKRQERNAKPFVIALPQTAIDLFKELKVAANDSPWVLPGTPRTGDGEAKAGHYDDKALGHAVRRLIDMEVIALPGGSVSPHDLRRTARTHLAKLKVPHWIVERVLNHSLGKIAATYDHHDYFEERREALEKWDAYVLRLLSPSESNVAFLPMAGA